MPFNVDDHEEDIRTTIKSWFIKDFDHLDELMHQLYAAHCAGYGDAPTFKLLSIQREELHRRIALLTNQVKIAFNDILAKLEEQGVVMIPDTAITMAIDNYLLHIGVRGGFIEGSVIAPH